MDFSVPLALERVLDTLLPTLDIVAQRVDDALVPAWCSARGWADYLLALSEQDLERCEAQGLSVIAESLPGLPASLRELAARVRELSELPALDAPSVTQNQDFRGVSWRKQQQLSALLGALTPLIAQALRIVDVGAEVGILPGFLRGTSAAKRWAWSATPSASRAPARVNKLTSARLSARSSPWSTPSAMASSCARAI